MRGAQVGMKKRYASEDARVKTCWATLLKYCGNIVKVPKTVRDSRLCSVHGAYGRERLLSKSGCFSMLQDPACTGSKYTRRAMHCTVVAQDPNEEKFRKIRLSNAAFQSRVGSVEGALQFLELLGFARDATGEFLEMARDRVSIETLNAAGGELNNALTNPFFGAL